MPLNTTNKSPVLTCAEEEEEEAESQSVAYGIMEMSMQALLFLCPTIFIIHFYNG